MWYVYEVDSTHLFKQVLDVQNVLKKFHEINKEKHMNNLLKKYMKSMIMNIKY